MEAARTATVGPPAPLVAGAPSRLLPRLLMRLLAVLMATELPDLNVNERRAVMLTVAGLGAFFASFLAWIHPYVATCAGTLAIVGGAMWLTYEGNRVEDCCCDDKGVVCILHDKALED